MSIREGRHCKLLAKTLATWLDGQGDDCWWSIDGDIMLMERVSFPCPGGDLASKIREIGKPLLLLLLDDKPDPVGDEVSVDELDKLAHVHEGGDRAFALCWEDDKTDTDWVLVEDKEIARIASQSDYIGV